MCPFCFANVGLVVAGVVSTGGLAALAAKVSRTKKTESNSKANEKEQ